MSKILTLVDHRPFPFPRAPYVMAQTWSDLLFAHWPMRPQQLEHLIPSGLTIDTYEGNAWVGVIPLRMCRVRSRWFPPLPGLSNFLELNLRTYVRRNGKPGVYFFSLDASNPLAVRYARKFFNLPYWDARMSFRQENGTMAYRSERRHGTQPHLKLDCSYRPTGPVVLSSKNSLEAFLTERYCLFTNDRAGNIYCGNVHHEQWPLQAAEAEIRCNEIGAQYGFNLKSKPLLHYSASLDTFEWALEKV
jgi:uncharacterized protein